MYIKRIRINKIRHIESFTLAICEEKIKHLLITGRNGAGKTTLINEIRNFFHTHGTASGWQALIEKAIKYELKEAIDETGAIDALRLLSEQLPSPLYLQIEDDTGQDCFVVYFDANRHSVPSRPSGVNKIDLNAPNYGGPQLGNQFVQYLVNMWAEKAFAREDGDFYRVAEIDSWFARLTKNLQILFEDESFEITFIRDKYNFEIKQDGKQPYTFHDLSAGQSAALSIVSELLLRLEQVGANISTGGKGIVIIDEIETHLHVSLQKKILPFLIDLFPTIQFIVTTHSPFVLISSSNTCILDMDRLKVFEDFSRFSYEAVIEDYFEVDQYSPTLKSSIATAAELIQNKALKKAKDLLLKISEEHEAKLRTSAELSFKINELLIKIREASNDTH